MPRPHTVMAMTAPTIPEGLEETIKEEPVVAKAALSAREMKRPGTTEPGDRPSMLDPLLKGHHRFDGTVWKQLCDSYNAQAQFANRSMQAHMRELDKDREKERAKEAIAEATADLRARVTAHQSRRRKLAEMLKENECTFRDMLIERRTRSQRQQNENPFALKGMPQRPPVPGAVTPPPREEMPEEAQAGFAAVSRSTPWSEHRAMTDRPTREDLVRRQQRYKEMLDAQVADKKAAQTRKSQADRDLDTSTTTSFYSPSHVWEERPWERYVDLEPTRYKNDLLRAHAFREKRMKQQEEAERDEYSAWVTLEMKRSADKMAKQEKKRLALNENLVHAWDQMCERKSQKRTQLRALELSQDKELLGGTFRVAEEKVRLLRKPRPVFQY